MRVWNKLPFTGGLLDQPATLMDLLDTVESEVQVWREKHAQEQEGDIMKQKMLIGLGKKK